MVGRLFLFWACLFSSAGCGHYCIEMAFVCFQFHAIPIGQFFQSFPVTLESFSGNPCVCPYLEALCLAFPLAVLVSYLKNKIFNSFWVDFYVARERGTWFHSSTKWVSGFPSTVEEVASSSAYVFGSFVDNLVSVCLEYWFCSFSLHTCFCASTMLFLLLWLSSIIWNQTLWCILPCSFCSIAYLLSGAFSTSSWILVFFLPPLPAPLFCEERLWNSDGDSYSADTWI